jgi:hypothetical protein
MHIHADRPDAVAKFWLYPSVTVAKNFGYNRQELSELARLIERRRDEIPRAWNEYFSNGS